MRRIETARRRRGTLQRHCRRNHARKGVLFNLLIFQLFLVGALGLEPRTR
jgi:hypothetical protein